jgi:hypothetical protein
MNLNKKLLEFAVFGKYVLAACCLLMSLQNVSAQKYEGTPATKQGIIKALTSKQFQTREIVQRINARGVDFQVTPSVQAELVAAGARPEIIEAVRSNYRVSSAPPKPGPKPPVNGKKFTGNPLDKDAIVTLLENGVADAQVRKNIESRGVNFKSTPVIKNEIKAAGGSVALLNLIALSYVDPTPTPSPAPYNPGGSDSYDSLIDKAVDQYDNKKDKNGALATLQQAVQMDANNSRAYQLLGFMNLYGLSNFNEAERYMKESLTRGGSAVFRVFHDHDGLFTDTCNGSLFIAKDTVRFESDNNVHTFQTNDADIKQVKTNSVFKRAFQTKTGSFKIVLKSGDDPQGVKFSFAPLTDNIAESKMIIRLIGKNN